VTASDIRFSHPSASRHNLDGVIRQLLLHLLASSIGSVSEALPSPKRAAIHDYLDQRSLNRRALDWIGHIANVRKFPLPRGLRCRRSTGG